MFNKKTNKYALSNEDYAALNEQLQKSFVEAGADLNDPTVRALYNKALEMAVLNAEAAIKARKTCTRDCIIITLTAAAGAAATFFLAPVPEQYKIPATIGVGAIGAIADVGRIAYKRKMIHEAEAIEAGSMAAFMNAMTIVSPKPAATAKPAEAVATSTATTEEIVNGEAAQG